MIEARRLLVIAEESVTRKGRPSQTAIRRAISTAYYALFHHLVRCAADTLVGVRSKARPRYALIYRAFDHGRMRQVSELLDKPTLGDKARTALGMPTPPQDLRDIATAFATLQERRHWADYDPTGNMSRSDALNLIEQAELAINKTDALPGDLRKDFLVFLMTSARA